MSVQHNEDELRIVLADTKEQRTVVPRKRSDGLSNGALTAKLDLWHVEESQRLDRLESSFSRIGEILSRKLDGGVEAHDPQEAIRHRLCRLEAEAEVQRTSTDRIRDELVQRLERDNALMMWRIQKLEERLDQEVKGWREAAMEQRVQKNIEAKLRRKTQNSRETTSATTVQIEHRERAVIKSKIPISSLGNIGAVPCAAINTPVLGDAPPNHMLMINGTLQRTDSSIANHTRNPSSLGWGMRRSGM